MAFWLEDIMSTVRHYKIGFDIRKKKEEMDDFQDRIHIQKS